VRLAKSVESRGLGVGAHTNGTDLVRDATLMEMAPATRRRTCTADWRSACRLARKTLVHIRRHLDVVFAPGEVKAQYRDAPSVDDVRGLFV
jgi:hypothetical protein